VRLIWILLIVSLALGAAQLPSLHTMSNHGASIFDFEFVRTTDRAHEILSGWGPDGRSAARTSLWIDYAYLIAYSLLFMFTCRALAARARRTGRDRWAAAGAVLAGAGLAAGAFDAIENAALLRILSGHTAQPYPAIASIAATAKFAMSACALAYIVAAWVALRLLGPAKAQT
jgi:hypothetical protein